MSAYRLNLVAGEELQRLDQARLDDEENYNVYNRDETIREEA